jgi:capsular exopolysaccharide synthesis family protein
MSRIQEILSKAERDGTARRTRALVDEAVAPPPPIAIPGIATSTAAPPFDPTHHAPAWTAAATAEAVEPQPARIPTGTLDMHLAAALAPQSLAAEQYRSLRTRIKRAENGRSVRTIVVTSPNKGDGKSLTAANLAITMAQEFQQRVLLVDADLRRPAIHKLFGFQEGPGLADVLMGAAELNQVLVEVPDYHLTLLPAGSLPSHPAELLGSAAMRRVLDTLRTRFDRVLIDMPPVAPLADLHIVAPMADGLLMIVRAGVTPKPAIERALAGLDVSKVLGLILNDSGGAGQDALAYEGYGYIAG